MSNSVISITEVTLISGKTAKINFNYNDQKISIFVHVELKAYFQEQFCRPSPLQRGSIWP
jgi:hypothetical protein